MLSTGDGGMPHASSTGLEVDASDVEWSEVLGGLRADGRADEAQRLVYRYNLHGLGFDADADADADAAEDDNDGEGETGMRNSRRQPLR